MFTHPILNWFFISIRVIPTVHGQGVKQEVVDRAIEILKRRNGWMHVFPEGGTNKDSYRRYGRLRWGIGRMMAESRPTLLPIRHFGMEQLDTSCGYRTFRPRVDIVIGTPVDTDSETPLVSDPQTWSKLTERVQDMLNALEKP